MAKDEKVFEILIVDDNPADAALFKHAWAECKEVKANVTVLQDARQALKYIQGSEASRDARKPDLVMLDYKHPMNGGLALAEIKSSPDHAHVPVIVLSGSSNPKDYLDAYQRHANICFRKPISANEFIDLVCEVAELWLLKAVLPSRQSPR